MLGRVAELSVRSLRDRAAVLDAVGHHPYGRFVAGSGRGLRGLAVGDAGVFWRCVGPFGPVGAIYGEPCLVALLLARAADSGLLDGLGWVNIPRGEIPPGWAPRESWDYRWLPSAAALVGPDMAVRPVPEGEDIDVLLDSAYPDSELRRGSPLVTQWYGMWVDGRLVACAADRSCPSPEPDAVPTGVIGGVAVHPEFRGRGLGAAVTAGVASVLLTHYDQVGLGVTQGNEPADRIYERIGFTGRYRLLSLRPM